MDVGRITVHPSGEIEAGSLQTFTFEYTVGAAGIQAGGSLRIATPNDDWEMPLAPMHRYFERGHERGGYDNGYCSYARRNLAVTLTSADPDVWIDLAAEECMLTSKLAKGTPWARHIIAIVRDGSLVHGDCIRIVYGDTTWGEKGIRVQRVAPTDKDRFRAFVDCRGTRDFEPVDQGNLAEIRIVPGPTQRFHVVLPAIVRPDTPFSMRVMGTDAFHNAPRTPFVGELRVGVNRADVAVSGRLCLTPESGGKAVVEGVCAHRESIVRFSVERSDGLGERHEGNPVWVTKQNLNLYFGDLHCQSIYHSDSLGSPAEGYAYGRDIAGLDFMGITDSGGWRKDGWVETQEATRDAYEPGRFVTFKGFEYGASMGHRNVVYRDNEIEPPLVDLLANCPEGLFSYFRGRDVIIIPHHTKVWTDWEYHDPELEPIAEVYSCWGSGVEPDDPLWHKSTKPGAGIAEAMRRGYRFGFIGSGDSHSGMPGRSFPADRQWCVDARSGLACVYASELTREAIFDALRRRHCYATTGERMILRFSVNEAMMGEEVRLTAPEQERCLRVHVIGTAELDHLRILRNGRTLTRQVLSGDSVHVEYVDTDPLSGPTSYFVRVVQKDGNTAWSSPVWVDF